MISCDKISSWISSWLWWAWKFLLTVLCFTVMYAWCRYGAVLMDDQNDDGSLGYTVLHNSSCQHAAPTFINLMNAAILRLAARNKNMTIQTRNHPLPMTNSQHLQRHVCYFHSVIFLRFCFQVHPLSTKKVILTLELFFFFFFLGLQCWLNNYFNFHFVIFRISEIYLCNGMFKFSELLLLSFVITNLFENGDARIVFFNYMLWFCSLNYVTLIGFSNVNYGKRKLYNFVAIHGAVVVLNLFIL